MGTSTNGTVCFGVLCEEGEIMPWMNNQYEGDFYEWWLEETGFNNTKNCDFAPWLSSKDDRLDAYLENRRQWLKDNPIPIVLENYCSDSDPMFAITVPGSTLTCRRGFPETFDPSSLVVTSEQIQNLISFLNRYNIKHDNNPRWLLISFWG